MFWLASFNPFKPFVVKAEYVLASSLPPFPGKGFASKQLSVFVSDVRDILANILKKNKVNMGIEDYSSFCAYYKLLSNGDTKSAAEIADQRKKH